MPKHNLKIELLKKAIVNRKIKLKGVKVNEYWIVSENTKRLLSSLENVIMIDDIVNGLPLQLSEHSDI